LYRRNLSKLKTRSPAIAEKAARTLSGIAVKHADDGYSRRGNFGGSLVYSTFLMYSPVGTNFIV